MSTRATNNGAGAQSEEARAERTEAPSRRRVFQWWKPRDWRVRSRLVALIVIPTAVALALGGLRIYDDVSTTFTHAHIEDRAQLGNQIVALANQLGRERTLSAIYIADSPDPAQRDQDLRLELDRERSATQDLLTTVRAGVDGLGALSGLPATRLNTMQTQLGGLENLRNEVNDTRITVLPVVTKYRQISRSLAEFNQTIAEETGDTELRESVRALTALSSARDQLSFETALMSHALSRDSMSGGISEAIDSSRARYDSEITNFRAAATSEQVLVFDQNFTGLEVSQVSTMRMRVMYRADRGDPLTGVTANDGLEDYQTVVDEALGRLQAVEESLAASVAAQANVLRNDAIQRMALDVIVVALVLLAVIILTSLVVRSLVRPLRILQESAERIAERDLPESISRMQEAGAPETVRVTPIDVDTKDEIGEVARAFDDVHRVALTLASDEAALRSNVNAMFVNLSRRSQTLVERQLRLIDGLEQTEQDSDRLSDLFQLDHLATRMRRNNENLLVLSGQDNTRKWAQPVPLVDVLRGAVSEVEQYERVNVRAPSHISVLGRPVNDVIHLVAELVENATSFSPHDTEVLVSAKILDNGGVQVDVTDSGIGMAPEDLEAINARLAAPPVIDVAVSRRMGLFVVSRLAARHGIKLRLMEAHGGGTTACVVFPPDLLITPVDPQQHSLSGGRGAPDTYAEAEAAFASTPAPVEPGDVWKDSSSNPGETGSGLPKRQPGGARGEEHPPSGQDLWSTGSPWKPAEASPERAAEPQEPAPGDSPWATSATAGLGQDQSGPAASGPPEEPPASGAHARGLFEPGPSRRSGASQGSGPSADTGVFGVSDTGSFRRPAGAHERPDTGSFERPDTGSFERPSDGAVPAEARTESFPAVPPAPSSGTDSVWNTGGQSEAREGYGSTAYLSRRYGGGAGQNTVVPPSPSGGSSDSLPIFDAIESNWFKRRTGGPTVDSTETGPIPQVGAARAESAAESAGAPTRTSPDAPGESVRQQAPHTEAGWKSDADRGWQAARTAAEPLAGGLTQSGLPKRVPKANLVPGTAPRAENFKQMPTRSADRVRNRFSNFQRGVREGRSQLGDGAEG